MTTQTVLEQVTAAGSTPRSRRDILKALGFGIALPAGAAVLTSCGAAEAPAAPAQQPDLQAVTTTPATGSTWEEMDRMHEAGIQAFPATTAAHGNQPLAPCVEHGIKVFDLTCTVVPWDVTPDTMVDAWTYNDQVPGPEIRVTKGDMVRMVVKNELPESTAVHPHGVMVPNAMDDVPFLTQPPIRPGETFTYEFIARNPGSHMYHAHNNSTKQVGKGLLGAFIIEPKERATIRTMISTTRMILNDQLGGFTINGKGFPATQPLQAKLGQKVRIGT